MECAAKRNNLPPVSIFTSRDLSNPIVAMVDEALDRPEMVAQLKEALAASTVRSRPLMYLLLMNNVIAPGQGKPGAIEVQLHTYPASSRQQLLSMVPAMASLVGMGEDCPPILIRFEITFTDGKTQYGVATRDIPT